MKSEWRKINGYIVKDIQQRTIITIYGAVTYYHRRYSYFDKEKNKQCYTFLVDREFQVGRKQRISLHLKLKILEEISSGSRQVDILKLYRVSGISQMTISNVIRQFNFANLLNCKNKSYEKIKVDKYLYAWIDETFIKLRNNGRKSTKYRFRLVTFHTGKRLTNLTSTRNELINKRAFCLIVPEKEEINTETFAKQVYNMADMFYENIKQAKIIIGGDGAKWIEDISKSLDNSEYVLDLFHGTRQLYWNLKKKQNVLYSSIYNHAANLLRKGSYLELINFLKVSSTFMRTQEQKQKLKALVKYFKIKKQGIINQGASWNVGVNAEGQVSHIIKWLLSYGAKSFNVKTFSNMLNSHLAKINNIDIMQTLRNKKEYELVQKYQYLRYSNWISN